MEEWGHWLKNAFHKFKKKWRKYGLFLNLWKLWNLWKRKNGAKMNLWKAADARFFRCCVAFLHFLTKKHKKRVNRIREAHSLRSVSIADGLSVPAGHLTHSALPHSGALTALRCFTAPFAHYGALRLRGPVFLGRWFSCWRRRMAQCTVCRKSKAQKEDLVPIPTFFIEAFI